MSNLFFAKVSNDINLKKALQVLDEVGIGIIVVSDKAGRVIGIATDGDFRRAILNGVSLDSSIDIIANKDFISVLPDYTDEAVLDIFKNTRAQHIPVLDKNRNLITILIEEDFLDLQERIEYQKIDIPVVIMAGGKGTRLEPFTKILPKPLIPIGEKPIIEIIMDNYHKYKIKDFYLTVNYKAQMIKSYFDDHVIYNDLNYIIEDKFLGTAGSLGYLKDSISSDFFLSNCDIIIKGDYSDIYNFHKDNNYDMTIIASMKVYKIPYGICEIENGGLLKKVTEKPEFEFLVNTGMYILNKNILDLVVIDSYLDLPELIKIAQEKGYKVGVYPISENSWIDTGEWEEYKNAINKISI